MPNESGINPEMESARSQQFLWEQKQHCNKAQVRFKKKMF